MWYDEAYRWPLANLEASTGFDPRRADDALWYLLRTRATRPSRVRRPTPVSYEALARVHAKDYLQSLSSPEVLAHIFATDPAEVPVDEMLHTLRLSCGGTLEAAREAVRENRACLNLLGGFHHAAPTRGAGFCALNDVAVAVATLRAEGFSGKVGVLDLDAHPPDGTAECLAADAQVWQASMSAVDWGPLPQVMQRLVPEGCADEAYLAALEEVLEGMPHCALTFVLSGGDVLSGDRLGKMGLSLSGARRRDARVKHALANQPSVWLPSGGYTPSAWKVLAGTGLVLAFDSMKGIPDSYDPLASRFRSIFHHLSPSSLGSEPFLTEEDLADALGTVPARKKKLLGFYSREGIEFALFQFGILTHLRRLGYDDFQVELDSVGTADRVRVLGREGERKHVLIEVEAERRMLSGGTFLFINWASLRHPRGHFNDARPRLPGQDVPGLGLSREMIEMFTLMARRLVLDGVAFRPSHYHVAYAGRSRARFLDPQRQGRFEALMRDLRTVPLKEATLAVAENRVLMNGAPYTWEPDDMLLRLSPPMGDGPQIQAERDAVHFSLRGVSGVA